LVPRWDLLERDPSLQSGLVNRDALQHFSASKPTLKPSSCSTRFPAFERAAAIGGRGFV